MKRNLFTLVFLMAASVAGAAYHEPYNSSRIFWDTTTRTTIFSSGGYARMIELQDGRYMACCESGGICISFSSNKGATWSGSTRIVDNHNNTPNCVPDLIQLTDGTIIVAYNPRPSTPYTEDRKFGIRCKRSTDNGQTWSDEIWINDAHHTFADGCWEPSMLELPSGEVQLYFADEGPFTSSGEQQISMCRSFDGGQTWTKAQRICFREGYRDGMPVPILLNDGQTIVVAIEDNGWSGFGSFVPTTVRCPLDVNWNNFWVSAGSTYRDRSINYSLCPRALGGAPYLRQLPWGETIMSHQSDYGPGENQMYVYVGNDQAKDFKAMSQPFGQIGTNDNVLWNSLAVVDTGTVVAVGGISGHIEMIKGAAVRELFANYAETITVDGKQTNGEGYFKPKATQVILGQQEGVRFSCDFAYDRDSLYFTTRVGDRTQHSQSGQDTDGLTLYLDMANRCETAPVDGMYRFFLKLDGTIQMWHGTDATRKWLTAKADEVHTAVTHSSTSYIIEAAIPWSFLGFSFPPVDQPLRAAFELTDCRSTGASGNTVREILPDCTRNTSWTYMAFRLLPSPLLAIDNPQGANDSHQQQADSRIFDLQGRPVSLAELNEDSVHEPRIYIRGGRKYVIR